MFTSQAFLVIGITWLAVISPGADFAVVSRNSSIYGRASGLATSVGIALGCWVHVAYAVVGLAIFSTFAPNFFQYIQILGAAYLIYIGVSIALSKPFQVDENSSVAEVANWQHSARGFLTNSLNPKTSLFVIALYSQVLGAPASVGTQIFWGGFISGSHLLWFALVTLYMSEKHIRALILRNQRAFNIVIGVFLVALGVGLFFRNDLGLQ